MTSVQAWARIDKVEGTREDSLASAWGAAKG